MSREPGAGSLSRRSCRCPSAPLPWPCAAPRGTYSCSAPAPRCTGAGQGRTVRAGSTDRVRHTASARVRQLAASRWFVRWYGCLCLATSTAPHRSPGRQRRPPPSTAATHASFCSSMRSGSASSLFFLKAWRTWSRSTSRLPPCRARRQGQRWHPTDPRVGRSGGASQRTQQQPPPPLRPRAHTPWC